jgi:hypothetical protein
MARDEADVIAPRLIVIAAQDHIGAMEILVEIAPPLTRAHRISCRRDVVLAQRDYVFFTLNDKDDAGSVECSVFWDTTWAKRPRRRRMCDGVSLNTPLNVTYHRWTVPTIIWNGACH